MFRIKLLLIIGGGALAYFGFQEFKVSKGSTAEPVNIELAEIETGSADTSNAHMLIGKHYPAFFELIYWGEEGTDKIDYVYYPVLSETHPFVVEINKLFEKYPEEIPEDEIPEVGNFSVLVKSKRYKTLNEIPDGFEPVQLIQGLAINTISSLKKDEEDLMRQSFPKFDPDTVLVLEENREPAGAGKKFGMMGGGVVLALFGVFLMFAGRGKGA